MSHDYALECVNLGRSYAGTSWRNRREARVALQDVNLTVERGEIHGLLGPNGAGKTTLIKLVSTLLLPSAGTAYVLGLDIRGNNREIRRQVGLVLGGDRGLYTRLTVADNMRYWCALFGQTPSRANKVTSALLEKFGLTTRADSRVETLSRGTRQRVHLARSLIGDPSLIILDEPTIGMDPVSAKEFRTIVRQLQAEGRTIVLTTHDMAEAEALCRRVSLIDRGRITATEHPSKLSTWLSRYEHIDVQDAAPGVLQRVAELETVARVESRPPQGHRVHTHADGGAQQVLRILVDAGCTAIQVGRPSLDDVYVHLVGARGLDVR